MKANSSAPPGPAARFGAIHYLTWRAEVFAEDRTRHHLAVDTFGSWVHVVEASQLLMAWTASRRAPSCRLRI